MCKETKLDIYNISSGARTKCYSTLCVRVCNTFGNDEDDDENCFHHGFLRLFSFSLPPFLALTLTMFAQFWENLFAIWVYMLTFTANEFLCRKLSAHYIKMHLSFAQASSSRRKKTSDVYIHSKTEFQTKHKDVVAFF